MPGSACPSFHPGPRSLAWALHNLHLPRLPLSCLTPVPLSLFHPDPCYAPLGLAHPLKGSLQASSLKLEHPTWGALVGAPTEGPGPREDTYEQWHIRPPYLQLDLLQPRNLTGQ